MSALEEVDRAIREAYRHSQGPQAIYLGYSEFNRLFLEINIALLTWQQIDGQRDRPEYQGLPIYAVDADRYLRVC